MSSLFEAQKVAGIDEYELRWAIDNIVSRRRDELEPQGSAGAALVFEFLAGVARSKFRDEVLAMRRVGLRWQAIAELLGRLEPGEEYESTVRLFDLVANGEDSWGNRYARWCCAVCDHYVTEQGPEGDAHPLDNERGHADDCERLAADIARYMATLEDW